MQAALMYDKEDLRVLDIETPTINANEILVKTANASICGTDLRMYRNGYRGITKSTPLITGHEMSGEIVAIGKNVAEISDANGMHYSEGMRVAIAPNMGCGICDQCVSGHTHLCPDYMALGINMNGAFAQYFKVPGKAVRQGNISVLPDDLSYEEASLAEPLSCVLNGFERTRIQPGDAVLILGAGPIGLMHAMMLQSAGAGMVLVNDVNEKRLKAAKELNSGLTTVESSGMKEKVMDLTRGKGVEVCITANASPQAQIIALELTAINGSVIYFGGIPGDADLSGINTNLIHYRQLWVTGTTRQSIIQFRKTLNMISKGLIDVRKLITHRHRLDQINDAFDMALRGEGMKHTIFFE